jgi:hypothetical protein
MARSYTLEELAAVAKQTAAEVRCEATCWWQDAGDPRRVYLEATHRLWNGRTISVRLMAFLPDARLQAPTRQSTGRSLGVQPQALKES